METTDSIGWPIDKRRLDEFDFTLNENVFNYLAREFTKRKVLMGEALYDRFSKGKSSGFEFRKCDLLKSDELVVFTHSLPCSGAPTTLETLEQYGRFVKFLMRHRDTYFYENAFTDSDKTPNPHLMVQVNGVSYSYDTETGITTPTRKDVASDFNINDPKVYDKLVQDRDHQNI